ncbi:MAG: cytochrome P450 [Alphaproteobacteria bacterium]
MTMDSTKTPRSGQLARFEPRERLTSLVSVFPEMRRTTLAVWTRPAFKEPVQLYDNGFVQALFLSDPDALRQVLTDPATFGKTRVQGAVLKPALGNGLLTSEGEAWAGQRRAMQPAFKGSQIRALVPMMAEVVRARLNAWRAEGPRELDLHPEMMDLTLEILCNTLFTDLSLDRYALGRCITDYLDIYARPDRLTLLGVPGWVPRVKWWQARSTLKTLRATMDGILATRLADPTPRSDFLTRLIEARDEETGRTLSHADIKDNLATFLAAGHETTAVALTWALYLLGEFPWAAERICEEADRVLGKDPAAPVTGEQAAGLTYTRQVLEEAMRLYPPVPMMDREVRKPVRVAGHDLRKGAIILISPYVLHRHERVWDDPEAFDPDRFTPAAVKTRDRYAYMPFNLGPRTCIGMGFALTEGTLALALIAQAFRVETLLPGKAITPIALVSLRPKEGMPARLVPRA